MPSSDLELVSPLPLCPLLDTGIVFRALGARKGEFATKFAVALFDGLLKNGSHILIAAPTVAEIVRGNADGPPGERVTVPRTRQVEVVSFTFETAQRLGGQVPECIIRHVGQRNGVPFDYIKYDAMIAACAAENQADAFITMDGWSTVAAERMGLKAHLLSEMFARPPLLPVTTPPLPKAEKQPSKRDRKAAMKAARLAVAPDDRAGFLDVPASLSARSPSEA